MQSNFSVMVKEIANLKKQKRKGWIIDGRSINAKEVESVSDHSWATSIIALLFLPETIEVSYNSDMCLYDKDRIIRMLIIHDLAESYIGDIPIGFKNAADKEREKQRFLYYSSLADDQMMSYLKEVNELWSEFELLESFNSKVAKDIDQIEGFIQLLIYKDRLIKRNGAVSWKNLVMEWKKNITIRTSIGQLLYNKVDEMIC